VPAGHESPEAHAVFAAEEAHTNRAGHGLYHVLPEGQ